MLLRRLDYRDVGFTRASEPRRNSEPGSSTTNDEDFMTAVLGHAGYYQDRTLSTAAAPLVSVNTSFLSAGNRRSSSYGRDRYEMAVLSAIDPRRIGLDAFEE